MAHTYDSNDINRSPKDVFESHLALRKEGKVEEDIQQNYAENVAIITRTNTYIGHDGVRESAKELEQDIPKSTFTYVKQVVLQNFAYLIWHAKGQEEVVKDGTDTFTIVNGKIVIQTIYYAVDGKQH